jgi:hypothetical protein
MGASGQTVVDFGAAPGSDRATVAVTGQTGILASSLCESWLDATVAATADHSPDEHSMASTQVGITCQAIVAGTGFTIVAASAIGPITGKFNVAWVWN